ncbi:MAG TPA: MATE family efflux transporter [Clostridia bacterium]
MQRMDTSIGTLSRLVWPIYVDNILRTLMGNVIIMLLGRLSTSVVAAVGTANQIFNMIVLVYTMFAAAAGIVLNQQLGADRQKDAADVMVLVLAAGTAFSLFCSAILFFFAGDLLGLIGLSPDLVAEGASYLRIVGGASFLYAINYIAVAICRSYGFTRFPMMVSLMMNLIQLAGSVIVILRPFETPFRGASGIAAAAAFSVFVSLIPLFVLMVRQIGFRIYLRGISVSVSEVLKAVLKVAIPSGVEGFSYNIGQLVITSILAPMGTVILTTRVIAQTLSAFCFMGAYSIAQGGQIIVGHLAGAGRMDDAYTSTLRNWRLGLAVNLAVALAALALARPLIGLYTLDPYILKLGVIILAIDIAVEIARAGNLVIGYALRGVGDAFFSMRIALPSVWLINVGLSYLLGRGFGLGLAGAWIGMAADESLRSVFIFLRWRSRKWERKRLVSND